MTQRRTDRMRQCLLLCLVAAGFGGCAVVEPSPGAALALPAGEGRTILERECLNCHELDALELFRDFYGREQWRSLVVTMRQNGAEVDDEQVEVLAAYLARHFGTEGD